MLMHEIIRDGRSPGALAACRGESSSLLKVLRRERRALAGIEDARYSYGRVRCAGDSIEDYQRQVSRLSACIGDYAPTGKCGPGSPLPYRWPGRPASPPAE